MDWARQAVATHISLAHFAVVICIAEGIARQSLPGTEVLWVLALC